MSEGSLARSAAQAAAQVVLASRVMGSLGDDLTLGHVSVRHADDDRVFIKRKGVAGSELTIDDVLEIHLDDPACLDTPGMHLEAVIHTEIYRQRPDVGAVIHGHPHYSTALSSTRAKLEFLTHDAVLFQDGIGLYSDSAELVVSVEQGAAVAESLGKRRATLLKNHGAVFVGEDVRYAVLAAVTLERAIKLQLIAGGLGPLDPLPEDQVRALFPLKYQDRFLDEYWAWWSRRFGNGSPTDEGLDGTP